MHFLISGNTPGFGTETEAFNRTFGSLPLPRLRLPRVLAIAERDRSALGESRTELKCPTNPAYHLEQSYPVRDLKLRNKFFSAAERSRIRAVTDGFDIL